MESDQIVNNEIEVIDTSFLDSTIVLNKALPLKKAKYKESRSEDEQDPAIFLNFTDSVLEIATPDLSNYYSQVKYVKLKHPIIPKCFFLDDVRAGILYKGGTTTTMHGLNSTVYLTPSGVIAGDQFFGFHFYDWNGDFKFTIAQTKPIPEYQAWLNVIKVDCVEPRELLTNFSVLGDNCLIVTETDDKNIISFFNIPRQNFYLTRPLEEMSAHMYLVKPNSYAKYYYNPLNETIGSFLESFNMRGDSLCRFLDYNPLVQKQALRYQNPERPLFYYYDGVLTIRQSYNDTIFRMISPSQLIPAFITFFGDKKLDPETALYGDKAGKMIRNTWMDTNKFLFIAYTENYDHQGNRDENTVNYFYRWYEKDKKQLYRLEFESYPEEFWIKNSIPNGIPLLTANAKFVNNQLYTTYSKGQLKKMMEHKNFSKLSIAEKETVKNKHKELKDGELLVMIVE